MTGCYHSVSCQSRVEWRYKSVTHKPIKPTYSVVRLFSPRREDRGRKEKALLLRSLQQNTSTKRAHSVAGSLVLVMHAIHHTTQPSQ